jgi:hypothetical protein
MANREDRANAKAARQDAKRDKGLKLRKARKSRKTQATKRDRGQGR